MLLISSTEPNTANAVDFLLHYFALYLHQTVQIYGYFLCCQPKAIKEQSVSLLEGTVSLLVFIKSDPMTSSTALAVFGSVDEIYNKQHSFRAADLSPAVLNLLMQN